MNENNETPKPVAAGSECSAGLGATIGDVLTSMARRFDEELLALQEPELEWYWNFQWNEKSSIEWNTYKFSDMLEAYKRQCRRWEEHHNGSCCVVERVRDKYVMPKVREFLDELKRHSA